MDNIIDNIVKKFKKVRIYSIEAIFNSYIQSLINLFNPLFCYKIRNFRICRRQKLLKKCEEVIEKKLDILNILHKLHESHTIIQMVKNKENLSLLRIAG